jgi:hypothetical protein
MPIGAMQNLEDLYAKQRLLLEEAARLDGEREALEAQGSNPDRVYLLGLESLALREESLRLDAVISDILDRDLQR